MRKCNLPWTNIKCMDDIFSGSCENGTFPCGKGDNLECVPQHLICERADECRDDYMSLCGIFYGYNDIIKNVMNTTDMNLTSNDVGYYYECGKIYLKAFSKFRIHFDTKIFIFFLQVLNMENVFV